MNHPATKSSSTPEAELSQASADSIADREPLTSSAPPPKRAKTDPSSNTMMRSILYNIVIPIAILSLGVGVVVALGSISPTAREEDDQSPAGRMRRLPAAEVSKVLSLADIGKPLELRVDGVVVPYREIELAAEVAGRIVKKSPSCEAGNYVSKGDFLFEIDDTDYAQEVERLTKMREQDYAALKEVDQEVANTRSVLDLANKDVAIQEGEVKRLESMPAGFASQVELDQAKKALLASMQNRLSFENQLTLLAARRNKLEAAERLATTQLRSAEINLERTKVYSPVDGVVVRENVELNSFIQRGSSMVTLEDVSKAEVAVNLRMDQLQWVLDQRREGEPTEIKLSDINLESQATDSPDSTRASLSQPGYSLPRTPAIIEYTIAGRNDMTFRWDGHLVRYSGIGLDARSRTVPVVVVVDQPRHFTGKRPGDSGETQASPSPLVRGMFVSVRLQIQPTTPLLAIPSVAIQPGGRVWQFVPDDAVLLSANSQADAAPPAEEPTDAPVIGVKTSADDQSEEQSTVKDAKPGLSALETKFNANAWKAGRVIVRRGVVPVDSLWLPADEGQETDSDNGKKERRYWVCEIKDSPMSGGDWVVTSPLGEFENELPARVLKDNLK